MIGKCLLYRRDRINRNDARLNVLWCAILITFLLLLSGCGVQEAAQEPAPLPTTPANTTTETTPAAATAEPVPTAEAQQPAQIPPGPGGNLIMTLGPRDPPSLDPALIGDVTSAFVARQIFSGLVQLDNDLNVQPDLAERWELSEDGRTYTFFLHPDAQFANGTPLTTADVRYSLERATDPTLAPSLPARTYLTDIVGVREKLAGSASDISGITIIDDLTIALTIDRPKSYFLSKLSHPTSYIVDQQAVEQGGLDWTQQPNGSGPFEIERWINDQLLVLRRNVNFHRDLARLDRVTFLIGAAANNPLILYEQGEIDVTGVPSFALDRVRDESNPLSQELVVVPQLSLSYIGMNVDMPPFDDLEVRQAFTRMLDRQRIADVTLRGSVVPARGILPPGMPGYNSALPDTSVDLDAAEALLAESRYGSAEALPSITAYGSGWVTTLDEVANDEFGIDIEVRTYETFGDYLAALDENQFPMFSLAWIADYPDPENFLDLLFRSGSGENHMNYSNPEVDRLLDQAATETDEAERWALYQQIEQLILADAPVIPITHDVDYTLVKPYVQGLTVTPMGILDLSTVELRREEE